MVTAIVKFAILYSLLKLHVQLTDYFSPQLSQISWNNTMLNYVYSCLRNLLVVKQGQVSFAYELLSLGMVLNKTEKLIRFFFFVSRPQ